MLNKTPNPIDWHVGRRVRMRRMLAGVSQDKLGEALGVTFQQIHKYENGSNRISASSLQQIAKMLDVPVSFFFDGAPIGDRPSGRFSDAASIAYVVDSQSSSEGAQLIKVFVKIKSSGVRRRVIELVEALAEDNE